MNAWGRQLAFALRYFTRFPLPLDIRIAGGDIARSIRLFPLVAFLEGIFVAIIMFLFSKFDNPYVTVAAGLAARYGISRGQIANAAHAFDGLARSRGRARMVEGMFEKGYGTMGACAVVFDVLLKTSLYWALLNVFVNTIDTSLIIIASCLAGKLAVATASTTSNSVFGDDRLIDASKMCWDLVWAVVLSAAAFFFLFSWQTAVLCLVVSVAVGLVIAGLISLKLGGLTKQTLGIVQELGEIVMLFVLLIW